MFCPILIILRSLKEKEKRTMGRNRRGRKRGSRWRKRKEKDMSRREIRKKRKSESWRRRRSRDMSRRWRRDSSMMSRPHKSY